MKVPATLPGIGLVLAARCLPRINRIVCSIDIIARQWRRPDRSGCLTELRSSYSFNVAVSAKKNRLAGTRNPRELGAVLCGVVGRER